MTVNADHLNKIPTYNYIAETTRFVIQILSQPWVTVENVAGLVQREHYCEIPCHDWKKPIASIDLNPTDTITWVSRPWCQLESFNEVTSYAPTTNSSTTIFLAMAAQLEKKLATFVPYLESLPDYEDATPRTRKVYRHLNKNFGSQLQRFTSPRSRRTGSRTHHESRSQSPVPTEGQSQGNSEPEDTVTTANTSYMRSCRLWFI